jgi:hypothetical protein
METKSKEKDNVVAIAKKAKEKKPRTMNYDRFIECAIILGVSEDKIQDAIKAGKIKRTGGKIVVD